MRKHAKGATSRRRAFIGVWTMLVLLTLALAALTVRQVASESAEYLDDRERRLRQQLDVALSSLRRTEDAILDDLERAFVEDGGDPGSTERRHPLVDRAFRTVENRLIWPSPPEPGGYGDDLGAADVGTPLARRLLDRAYGFLAGGEPERALEAFEHSLKRKLLPATQAEVLLQMATILAANPSHRRDAVDCLHRVLQLEARENGVRAGLAPWMLAARYRRARLLLDLDLDNGIEELLALLESLVDASSTRWSGRFTTFYRDRAFEELDRFHRDARLSTEEERRFSALSASVQEQRDSVRFAREMHELWLPTLRSVESRGTRHRRLFRESAEGSRLLIFRSDPADSSGVVGARLHLSRYGDRLLELLRTAGSGNPESRSLRVLSAGGELLFGEDTAHGTEISWLSVGLSDGLPWRVELPVSEDVRRFRRRRAALYGGLAGILVLVVTIAALTTLRGMQRAVELADLKSEFVANVSHELKTPLTVIRMFTDLLLLGYTKDAAESRENLKVIARETENLSLFIDNVLDLSRIDAGEKQYHPAPTDLAALVDRTVDQSRPYLERRGFAVVTELPRELPTVEIDPAAFARALGNLLSNAEKYSGDRREIEIAVRLEGRCVLVDVADRGVGLRPEEIPRVFDRFFHGGRVGARRAEGSQSATGIGLAIVKHSVESHGGQVYAAAREGGGSRFTMKFPLPESRDG